MSFPGNTSLKNAPISPAAQSLGLGDQLQTQLQDELDEQKKKKMAEKAPAAAASPLNPATSGISAAVQSLLGSGTGA
jgi:hypothetical protein